MTLDPAADASSVLARVDVGNGCSVKDSYAALDLAAHGFYVLFDAEWIVRRPGRVEGPVWAAQQLFDDASITRFGHEQSGAIANVTDDVVGVSNVTGADAWARVVASFSAHFPDRPIVGYEHGDDLDAAIAHGFESIGPLRVWMRAEA